MRRGIGPVILGFGALTLAAGAGCGSSGSAAAPASGCGALQACCGAIADPSTQAACQTTLSSDQSLPDSDETCQASLVDYESLCGTGVDGGPPPDADDGGEDGGGAPNAVGGYTSPPVSWGLPGGYAANSFDSVSGGRCTGFGTTTPLVSFIADLNQDKKYDLVVSSECGSSGTVGVDHWLVYLGTGTSFSKTATNWTLPTLAQGFNSSYPLQGAPGVIDDAGDTFDLTDYNGDGKPDLVLGNSVYVAKGNGFSTTSATVAAPAKITSSDDEFFYDINGDGNPDLVVYNDGTESTGVGTSKWLVYLGTGNIGYASTATDWTLPAGALQDTFKAGIMGNSCAGANYFVQDLDGDGKPDLIVTDDCDSSSDVGVTYWSFYKGSGHGFATSASKWALPKLSAGGSGKPFGTSTNGESMGALELPVLFSTQFDYNGDQKPDLYVANTYGTIGPNAANELYVSTGAGFSTTAGAWTTPLTSGDATWFADNVCGDNGPIFETIDFNFDGTPDLVVSDTCAGGSSKVGTNDWEVYLGKYK